MAATEQAAHGEVDPAGVVLAMDPVGDVVEQAADGGLLQGHGGRQAAADQGGPFLADAVPVPRAGQVDTAVHSQQAVQSALSDRTQISNVRWCPASSLALRDRQQKLVGRPQANTRAEMWAGSRQQNFKNQCLRATGKQHGEANGAIKYTQKTHFWTDFKFQHHGQRSLGANPFVTTCYAPVRMCVCVCAHYLKLLRSGGVLR